MSDITELAQSLKAAAIDAKELAIIARYSKGRAAAEKFYALANPNNVIALVEALEKAQQYAKERDEENQDLMLTIGRFRVEREGLEAIRAAAEKLVRCKGRYHSEQNYRALAALFGVNTPDLPPLDDESHAVTVENLQESAYRAGLTAGWNLGLANNNDGFNKCLAAHTAGIKVEAE
ncbi:TPA: ead/Ea22-like family protein [Klebsiella pneumoniae]|nr:ead/Ea22-like family protein [Klebsiella pneumoniae]HCB0054934.1 ead/Ea22-like family protein [Klebsiella pneumoniae]HCB1438715.1 ead/Ea22-like family protein [Klebsiella pneumoniae]HCI7028238.1 ead/Ea22-like family protein [Klebsiella pneumoniae]